MKPQFDNQVLSSFLLWFDNKLLTKGEAFQNTTGQFYSVLDDYYGYNAYASSYSQIVADASIPGATIPTGLYAGNTLVNVGEGGNVGLYAIDYNNGRSYWSGAQSSDITGSFAIKDFNVFLTNQTEDEILFQTQYTNRNQISDVVPTGLQPDTKTYPVVYLKNAGGRNEPFAFGGQDNTIVYTRAIIVADSQYEVDAIGSIFRDTQKEYIPLLTQAEQPFNALGGYRDNVQYNYTGITDCKDESQKAFLDEVNISRFDRTLENEVRKFNPNVYSSIIDFEISKVRFPRQ
jgi:hypothetical protein|tara:strand:+ start:682 stop:1548 length:867 start_codon:yes stop_codon:yes gene_type:complete